MRFSQRITRILWFSFFITWEQRKFESLAETRRGLTYNPSNISPHGIRVLRSSNINEDTFVLSDDDVFVCPDAVKIECAKPNDILITAANGSTRLVGKHAIIVGIRENEAVHGGFMLVASSSMPFFLNAAMSAPWYLKFINLFVAGGNGAIGNLNKNDLDNQLLFVPKNAEQEQIGEFFRNFDNLITLHQRKQNWQNSRFLRKISSLILAIAWEQRKLGDIVSVCSGKDYKHLNEGDIPVYGTGGYMLSVSEALSYFDDAIGIGRKGTIDKPYILKAPFWTVDTLFYAVPKEKTALDFVYCLFQIIDWKSKDESTGVPSLSKVAINSVDISVPKSEEQVRIGTVFFRIDNLITLHQCEEILIHNEYGSSSLFRSQYKMANAWEQRKVQDVAERYDNLRVPVAANLRVHGNIPYYGANGIQDYVDGFTHDGEFVLVAEDGANDLKNYPVQHVKGRIWVNNHAHVLQGKSNLMDNLFLAYSLHRADMASYLVGGSRAKLNADTLMTLELLLPSVVEQAKIGRLLDSIDNLITLHQCKRAAFVSRKSPSIFQFEKWRNTLTWEQRKFGEYFEERNERSGEGELISVTINSGIKKFNELGRFDTKPEDLSKYKRVEVGDIAYNSMRMWQGASGYSPYSGILSPAYTVISPRTGVSSMFFAYSIKRPQMIHLFEINSQGLTSDTWNLKFPAFSQIEASAPTEIAEQKNIAEIFTVLDNLITLHQRGENIYNRRQTW